MTSGFDSAILAETEIQGQVKSCYQQAHQTRELPFELHYLFQKALKTGKEIRTKLKFTKPIVDLEQAILHFGQGMEQPQILFVGASRTNLKIAFLLTKETTWGYHVYQPDRCTCHKIGIPLPAVE